jgi:hypothetical protein
MVGSGGVLFDFETDCRSKAAVDHIGCRGHGAFITPLLRTGDGGAAAADEPDDGR